jgi:hypothetical protein
MEVRKYKVSDLRRFLQESANEFKPVMGKNVAKENQTNNEKAYKDMEKEAKAYDGGVKQKDKAKPTYPNSDNKGMQDLEYTNMSKDFKERVKSQMKGYTSADAEKNHKDDAFGNADFHEIENMKERHQEMQDGKNKAKEIGLTSREIDKKEFENQSSSVFEAKTYVLKFKNTTFLTEQHMLSKVPDDFKVEGKKFIMKDKMNNEYLVEWKEEPIIFAKTKINEQQKRIHELFAYKRGDSKTNVNTRLTEDKKINDMLGRTRALMK